MRIVLQRLELAETVVVASGAAILQGCAGVAPIARALQLAAVARGRPRGVLWKITATLELREGGFRRD